MKIKCFEEINFATSGQKSIKMNGVCPHKKKTKQQQQQQKYVAYFFLKVGPSTGWNRDKAKEVNKLFNFYFNC